MSEKQQDDIQASIMDDAEEPKNIIKLVCVGVRSHVAVKQTCERMVVDVYPLDTNFEKGRK